MLSIDPKITTEMLKRFIKEEMKKIGVKKAVFGLSGGVDSAVAACLLVRSLGKHNVHALIMPYKTSNPESQQHAELLANQLQISYDVQDISPVVDLFFEDKPDADNIRRGNKMARERMCLLYDYSAANSALVIGTSNKTEILLGYGTIFGDLAYAINPLGDLYKSQIWKLAEYLDVPQVIIDKAPSADLWVGQTDEEEIGYKYSEIDKLFYYIIDLNFSDDLLIDKGYGKKTIKDIQKRIQKNKFKRRPPVIAKLTTRTIDQDSTSLDWDV